MKPNDVTLNTYIDCDVEKILTRLLNLKSGIMIKYHDMKTVLQKPMLQKVKNIVPQTYVIGELNGEEIIGTFYEKELKKTNQKVYRMEKVTKKKFKKYMISGNVMIIRLIAGQIKKVSLFKLSYFPKPYSHSKS